MAKRGDIFKQIAISKPSKNLFDLSHDVKLTCDMGELIPFLCLEAVPGDKFHLNADVFGRTVPLVSPVLHRCDVSVHYFFVPNRLLWSQWEDWITGQLTVNPPICNGYTSTSGFGNLGDYLGLSHTADGFNISTLPIAAYCKIYDEYYRDQNIIPTEKFQPLSAGGISSAYYYPLYRGAPFKRAWNHDYFTSALPWAQKGAEVTLPLTQDDDLPVFLANNANSIPIVDNAGNPVPSSNISTNSLGAMQAGTTQVKLNPNGTLFVDANSESVTINTLRRAFALQSWLEKNARGGTRYIESMNVHFGVISSDKRLQRPEYIGGAKHVLQISEVLSQAQTLTSGGATIPIGQMAGRAITAGSGKKLHYFAEEHGFLIGIISTMPKTAYNQGIPRMFKRESYLDYFWPSFANIGEQEIRNHEIYALYTESELMNTFGYTPRYSEYKYMPSRSCGLMKSTLNYWHFDRQFTAAPALNQTFIECTPRKHAFADQVNDALIFHIICDIKAIRPMPKFGTPSL